MVWLLCISFPLKEVCLCSVSPTNGSVLSVPICFSEGGVAVILSVPVKKLWSLHLSSSSEGGVALLPSFTLTDFVSVSQGSKGCSFNHLRRKAVLLSLNRKHR